MIEEITPLLQVIYGFMLMSGLLALTVLALFVVLALWFGVHAMYELWERFRR
jgi:hypothetical protein